jgi:hypothetical protein
MTRKLFARLGALILALVLAHAPAWSQGTAPSGPAESTPSATGERPTLVPNAGDPVDVDESVRHEHLGRGLRES